MAPACDKRHSGDLMRVPTAELDASGTPRLRRVLTLWDLAFYGLVAVTPSAPATVFGLAQVKSHGHAVDTILAAMVAMVLTAISYGRMAALYPSAGSAYTYVGRGLHPYLGFVSGWAMLLDYVVSPLFCVMFGTLALMRSLPALPFPVGAALFAGGITYLNLRGIRSTVRANQILLGFMFIVLLSYVFLAIRCLIANTDPVGCFRSSRFMILLPSTCATSRVLPLRGPDIPRLRCCYHTCGRRKESAAQRDAGRCWGLRFYRLIWRTSGLSRPVGLAGLQHLFERRDGIHRSHRTSRRNCVVSRDGDSAVDCHDWRR